VDVADFTRPAAAAGIGYQVLQVGERFVWRKPG
jgi:hypothetical protein